MRILLVEDDDEYVRSISKDLVSINGYAKIVSATSRDSARAMLDAEFFDLIVLDLKIPTVDGAVDAEPEHGYAAFEHARHVAAGTPIFVLTGSPAEPFIEKLTANVNQVDIWGGGLLSTVQFLPKHRYGSKFIDAISPYLASFAGIFEVELQKTPGTVSKQEDRILRIFASQCGAAKCVVQLLSGGLSGAKVFRIKLTNSLGAPLHDSVTKIGKRDEVFDENYRFDTFVSRLEGKATPRKLGLVHYGAGNVCGVFYGLAEGYESDAFAAASSNGDTAEIVVRELENLTARWRNGLPETRHPIRRIRQHAVADNVFLNLRASIPYDWLEDFENKQIQTIYSCTHGDMHGLNVLMSNEGSPILIDYGDVGDSATSWDPVTLELSLFFHPKGPLQASTWPSNEHALMWGNLDEYLEGCPMPRFIRACRAWATRCAAGNREIAATAYSYLIRQLKYKETNRDRALALVLGAKLLFEQS